MKSPGEHLSDRGRNKRRRNLPYVECDCQPATINRVFCGYLACYPAFGPSDEELAADAAGSAVRGIGGRQLLHEPYNTKSECEQSSSARLTIDYYILPYVSVDTLDSLCNVEPPNPRRPSR